MAKRKSSETIDDLGEKIGGARKDMAVSVGPRRPRPKVDADPRPAWMRRFIPMEQIDRATKAGTGRWSLVDMGQNEKYGGRAIARDLPSAEAAEKMIPMAAVARNHKVRDVGSRDEPKYEIWRDVTDRKRVRVTPETFKSRDDAMKFMAEHAVKIIETKTGFGEEILVKPEKVFRTGPEVRMGDIASESFMKTLGMRAIEFGNWQGERQTVMNHAYDAMRDLAHVTGIAPQDVSLKSELGIAFGARGHGLSSARAHYEPKYGAINLTKLDGAGALAHEWWHGLDHLLGRTDDPRLAERDPKASTKAFKEHLSDAVFASHRVGNTYLKGDLPAPVRAAYKDLIDTIYHKPEQYTEDKARAERFTATTQKELASRIADVRKYLAEPLTYGKRYTKPATAAQLAAFDKAAQQIIAGEALKTEWRSFPKKANAWNGGFGTGARWTNDALEQMSAVYKEVRGRSGFDSQDSKGALDQISGMMRTHENRLAMLSDAAAQSVKTKLVPTNYAMQARRLDEGRVGDYWQVKHEMTARAFSAYVEDMMKASGRQSDYLSFGSDNKYFAMLGQKPFPEGPERAAINDKFDALFKAMRETGMVRAAPDADAALHASMAQSRAALEAKARHAWDEKARAASAAARAPAEQAKLELPPHLQALVAKMNEATTQATVTDRTPAGYGPSEPVPGVTDAASLKAAKEQQDAKFQKMLADTDKKILDTLTARGDTEGLARHDARQNAFAATKVADAAATEAKELKAGRGNHGNGVGNVRAVRQLTEIKAALAGRNSTAELAARVDAAIEGIRNGKGPSRVGLTGLIKEASEALRPGWSDAARAASADVRAKPADPSVSSAVERAMQASAAKAVQPSTLVAPETAKAPRPEPRGLQPKAEAMGEPVLAKKAGKGAKALGLLAPVGIAAAMLSAANEAKAEGTSQAKAAAKAGAEGAGTMGAFVAGHAGVTMGLVKAGMRAASAIPAANALMIAGGALHGAWTAKPGARLSGAAKGAWDMSLPGMAVNTGLAVHEAVKGRVSAPVSGAVSSQPNGFSAANQAYKAMQQSKAEPALRGTQNPTNLAAIVENRKAKAAAKAA